jgi:helicase MOV-10
VKILACAPSDAAADVLCIRLSKHFSSLQLFRLNWWQRLIASVPIEILKFCYLHKDHCFEMPSLEMLSEFNIIVTTTVTAGFLGCLSSSQQPPLAFDLILIDEVSQATEAETYVPISLCNPTGLVVLAGDPEQLGPSVRSPAYHFKGMAQSLLEKLLKQKLYDDIRPSSATVSSSYLSLSSPQQPQHNQMSQLGTYLTSNYRSQKSILSLPSQLFYLNSLRECHQNIRDLDSLGSWEPLRNAKLSFSADQEDDQENEELVESGDRDKNQDKDRPFVVLFKGIDGRHRHEVDSPTFYNLEEIAAVVEICSSLLSHGSHSSVDSHGSRSQLVTTKDIGVIGAFRSQVLKLRLALRAAGMGGINVGSVEDFQGQEVRIILISTVLSHRIPQLEMCGSLGLLGDHRKFNVALTRGMHLAVVVGHPYCLHSDPNWRQLMNYCDDHGTYTGYPCSLLERVQREMKQENDLLNSIARISLLGGAVGDGSWNDDNGGRGNGSPDRRYFPETLEWRGLL